MVWPRLKVETDRYRSKVDMIDLDARSNWVSSGRRSSLVDLGWRSTEINPNSNLDKSGPIEIWLIQPWPNFYGEGLNWNLAEFGRVGPKRNSADFSRVGPDQNLIEFVDSAPNEIRSYSIESSLTEIRLNSNQLVQLKFVLVGPSEIWPSLVCLKFGQICLKSALTKIQSN